MSTVKITRGYRPGSIGRVAELHGRYYHEHWGFGLFFESKVAIELATFLERYDDARDGFWLAKTAGRVEGSITIDGHRAMHAGAHLRWFIVSEALQGGGVGKRLIETAIGFCRQRGFRRIYLWTFEGLDAARHLYTAAGFTLVEQHRGTQWGAAVNEQRFERCLR
ncbi:MAG: GNAT family N-acetyltransferase [Desulfosarcinaceae bacterium]|nr:GNAT family N-acetyltransferase [Desulfosarcinaceae bacterium]